MRKGRLIISTRADKKQISKRQLARLMVGRDVVLQVDKEPVEPGGTVLSLKRLSGESSLGGTPFKDISFDVKRGEIFSIIGVAGNGQSALVAAITGLAEAQSGQLSFLDNYLHPPAMGQRRQGPYRLCTGGSLSYRLCRHHVHRRQFRPDQIIILLNGTWRVDSGQTEND